jgi:hypothetical protein
MQRDVRYLPEAPAYLLALVGKRKWLFFSDYDSWVPMRDSIANHLDFPGDTKIFLDVKIFRGIVRDMKQRPEAKIYQA